MRPISPQVSHIKIRVLPLHREVGKKKKKSSGYVYLSPMITKGIQTACLDEHRFCIAAQRGMNLICEVRFSEVLTRHKY